MPDKMTKTEMFINIIFAVLSTPEGRVTHSKLLRLLESYNTANRFSLINELTKEIDGVRPILAACNSEKPEDRVYEVNPSVKATLLNIQYENNSFLENYKHLGRLINEGQSQINFKDVIEFNGKDVNDLDRKFMCFSKVAARTTPQFKQNINVITDALINHNLLQISYPSEVSKDCEELVIEPLTIGQYQDEYFIMCQVIIGDNEAREYSSYNISKIKQVEVLNKNFVYPPASEWSPEDKFYNSSIEETAKYKDAKIKIYGQTRAVFKDKVFFGSKLISESDKFDEYQCRFISQNEFIGQLFVYAQDIEVVSPENLRHSFIGRALDILMRNTKEDEEIELPSGQAT